MDVKLLNEHQLEFLSLNEGCTFSSESTLVKMPHCWKSHALAQLLSKHHNVHKIIIAFSLICVDKRSALVPRSKGRWLDAH